MVYESKLPEGVRPFHLRLALLARQLTRAAYHRESFRVHDKSFDFRAQREPVESLIETSHSHQRNPSGQDFEKVLTIVFRQWLIQDNT